ncbi:MAG: YlxR family protein [Lachnospiraceae bacterium]|nr:YlxR family protein [Lachnospiraceae bacterium]
MTTKKNKPLRKCIGCNEMKEKHLLIRIAKISDDEFQFDESGKINGRGAYICKNKECLEKAMKNKGLERSFKCKISIDLYDRLEQELRTYEA